MADNPMTVLHDRYFLLCSMLADTPMMPKKGRKLNRSGINNGRQETHNRRKRRKNVNKSRSEKRK